jgi:phosphopantetheine--protein transferase-like protein
MFDIPDSSAQNFNVGIDCEDIERWRGMLPKLESGPQRKIFTEEEHRYCRSHKDPAPHYAARWCAKEAVFKALSPFCRISLRQIEIVTDQNGRPFCRFSDPEVMELAPAVSISLSHSKQTAMAVAMVAIRKRGTNG